MKIVLAIVVLSAVAGLIADDLGMFTRSRKRVRLWFDWWRPGDEGGDAG
jgi:hypothetical protein